MGSIVIVVPVEFRFEGLGAIRALGVAETALVMEKKPVADLKKSDGQFPQSLIFLFCRE